MQRECILLPSVFELCIFLVWSHHRGPRSRGCRTPWRSSNADGGAQEAKEAPHGRFSSFFFLKFFYFHFGVEPSKLFRNTEDRFGTLEIVFYVIRL